MTQDALAERVGALADAIVSDPRWEQDDLNVSVLGMLLYGFALGTGRIVMFLDMEDIDAAVLQCLTEHLGAAEKWSRGLTCRIDSRSLILPVSSPTGARNVKRYLRFPEISSPEDGSPEVHSPEIRFPEQCSTEISLVQVEGIGLPVQQGASAPP